ncbi:glycoside hydrolase family 127 protein [Arthrobacter sp. N199823]|uniref:glycoside hydrolase family 127 protein n=1 Tax=Arthrobacter sp. N199823 TaxID=2058895 RepID=UPI000CE38DC0|nr:beta-L-arabinofuranosidase domain-containing protein [Arthrobacter sp. N199823]
MEAPAMRQASGTSAVNPGKGVLRPLATAAVKITGGLLAQWQQRNRTATIPHSLTELRKSGNLENFRTIINGNGLDFVGRYPFLDTDIYKTLEGLVYELARDGASELLEERDFYEEAVELIVGAQSANGYLSTYYQNPTTGKEAWSDLTWGHELYNLGHLIQAAVAAKRQLGDDRLLEVARHFADHAFETFGPDGIEQVCGHPEVEMALVELSRETGCPNYLELATLFIDRRGRGLVELNHFPAEYFQDNHPLRELPSVTGHAVRMGYLAAGAADVAAETADTTLFASLERLWQDMVNSKLYITGGLGSRHSDEAIGDRYELPSERSYSETCAAISIMQWGWRMFLATADTRYIDVFETVLYNAYAVGLSLEGTKFFYDNPLQRRGDHEQRSGAETDGDLLRRSWFGCPCCPPNVIRWMSELQDYIAVEKQDSLFIANYATATIRSGTMAVDMKANYPWDGNVLTTVTEAPEGEFMLAFRVPAWAKGATLAVNDEAAVEVGSGWAQVEREWRTGDRVQLVVPMVVSAHISHPHLDATRGSAAVVRGPLVYCAEQQDNETSVDDLIIDSAGVAQARTLDAAAPSLSSTPALGADVVTLTMPVRVAEAADAELYPLLGHSGTDTVFTPGTATLVPYFLWGNRQAQPMRVWLRTY